MAIQAKRYHDISTGHRVHGHESKCAHLHGHNYRVHFTCEANEGEDALDSLGRVIDFSVIKEKLCMWIENNWDHKFLISFADPFAPTLKKMDPEGVVITTFNPTAENMAAYLLEIVGPSQLLGTGVRCTEIVIEETAKCHVAVNL